MRLLHVIANVARASGGPSKAAVDMALSVRDLGHEVTIYATDFGGETVSLDEARASGVDIQLFSVAFPRFWQRSPALKHALEQTIPQCDLVYIHSLYLYHCWIAAGICRRHGVPYIVRPHGTLDPFFYRRHRFRKSLLQFLFQDRALRDAAAILYTSLEESRLARPLVHNPRAEIIPLSLNEREFRPLPPRGEFRKRFSELSGRVVVLFLGRLNFKKGLDLVFPAFEAALKNNGNLHLVLAGADDGTVGNLNAEIEKLRQQQRITVTGFIGGRLKLAALADADIFILPSYSENFGISVIEAMFCGLPIIVSDKVNIFHDTEAAKAGRVIPLSVECLTEAILEFASDKPLRDRCGAAGEALVRAQFMRDRVGRMHEAMCLKYWRHAERLPPKG